MSKIEDYKGPQNLPDGKEGRLVELIEKLEKIDQTIESLNKRVEKLESEQKFDKKNTQIFKDNPKQPLFESYFGYTDDELKPESDL